MSTSHEAIPEEKPAAVELAAAPIVGQAQKGSPSISCPVIFASIDLVLGYLFIGCL